jgi:phthiocerol/phenolphthiocerol synthesis type-I polyketide synthase E
VSEDRRQRVAVIGLAGRFPGAASVDELWHHVRSGIESIETFPRDELLAAGVPEETLDDPAYVPARGALAGHDLFDAHRFGFTAREAEVLDPQHRLLLECAVEALDAAGRGDPGDRRVGVFAGCGTSGYLINVYSHPEVVGALGPYQVLLANDKDFLATRVAYKLDLGGPGVTVQAACSTSLVAVHLACQSLLSGECDMALAGGVMSTVPERTGYLFQEQGISSPDGHCRPFDADAAGTVSGSGVGLVVLARLEDALAEGDPIRAVVLGSAINNDGSSKVGYTAPSVKAQARVVAEALAVAGVDAGSIGYVEAHGTGTSLGDPVEVTALSRAFRLTTGERGYCSLGSIKANIGHLDAAAGVAGLIKTILALEHREIPPLVHFRRPNPQIDFAASPFTIPTGLASWRPRGGARRAGVSSLGIGGTNAHLVLEEAPAAPPPEPARDGQLLVLSAATGEALDTASGALADHLERHEELALADVAFTLQAGRRRHPHRLALVCRDRADAVEALRDPPPSRSVRRHDPALGRPVVFLFPGQGAQHPGMGAGLYRTEPLFRHEIDRAADELAPVLGHDLRRLLYEPPEEAGTPDWTARTDLVQPALFAHEHALARLWTSWGVEPRALLGHSIGEWVAACLAGVFSFSDALALVALRGRLMQGLEPGAMTAVQRNEDELRELLAEVPDDGLALAAVNAPEACVVSGSPDAISAFEDRLAERRVAYRRLRTSHAFHSPAVDPVLDELADAVAAVERRPPRLRLLSNVTGDWLSDEEAVDPGYWRRHLREPVRFAAAVERLVDEPDLALLEVGPGRSLGSLVRRRLNAGSGTVVVASVPAKEPERDREGLLSALARLWTAGVAVDWRAVHAPETRRRVVLPSYPFERRRYWLDRRPGAFAAAPRPRKRIDDWFYRPLWRQTPSLPPPAGDAEGTWLVIADEAGVADALAPRLSFHAERVVTVRPGTGLSFPDEGPVGIDPRSAEHYEELLRRVAESGPPLAGIVHLTGVTAEPRARASGEVGTELFAEAQERGFYSIVALARALAHRSRRERVRLVVVTNRAQALGEGTLEPEKATVLAPCRVIPQEIPNVTCRAVDFGRVAGAADRVAARVLEEALGDAAEPTVAYRAEQRWVEEQQPEPRPALGEGSGALRDRGVYLITGGLGRIGRTVARHLARNVRARLILVGRRALPERERWPEHRERDDETARRIRAVEELEELGAQVRVAECDVADGERMREVLELAEQSFGGLDGVIHAAGSGGGGARGLVTVLDRLACEEQFVAKAYGTLVLDRLLAGREIDFVILFSSLSTVLGGLGFSAYAAANRFLEAWAEARRRAGGTPWTAIAWDAWRGDGDGAAQGVGARLERDAIAPDEGVEVLDRILASGTGPRVTVASGDLERRYQEWVRLRALREEDGEAMGAEAAGGEHPRPPLPVPYAEPRNEIETELAAIWSELLGVAPIGIHDDFFDLGGHSLLGIQLNSRLRGDFDLDLPLGALFEHTTVSALGALIEEALVAEIDDLSEEEAARLLGRDDEAGVEVADEQ